MIRLIPIIIMLSCVDCRAQITFNMVCHEGNGGTYPDITVSAATEVDFFRLLDSRFHAPLDSIENVNGKTACFKAMKPGKYLFYAGRYDNSCVTMSDVYEVKQPPKFYLIPIAASSSCSNRESYIRVNRTGGIAPYIYSLVDSAGSVIREETSDNIVKFSGIDYGKYHIEATDANGCKTMSATRIINKFYGDVHVDLVDVSGTCGNANGFIKASAKGNFNYRFKYDLSGEIRETNTTGEFANLPEGTYYLRATEMTYQCESINTPIIHIDKSKANTINLQVTTEIP